MEKITVSVNKDTDTAIYTMEEGVTYQNVHDAIVDYYNGPLTKYTVWDWSNIQHNHLTNEETKQLGQQVRSAGKARQGGAADLIIVPDIWQYALARLYAAYASMTAKDTEALRTKIFRKLDDALVWIRRDMTFKEYNV